MCQQSLPGLAAQCPNQKNGESPSPGFAVPIPALLFVGRTCCHALILADGVGQRRPDLFRELQFLFYVCDLIKKARRVNSLPSCCPFLHKDMTQVKVRESVIGRAQTLSVLRERHHAAGFIAQASLPTSSLNLPLALAESSQVIGFCFPSFQSSHALN